MSQRFNDEKENYSQDDYNSRYITTNRRKISEICLREMNGDSFYKLNIQQGLTDQPMRIGKNLSHFIESDIHLNFKTKKLQNLHRKLKEKDTWKDLESIKDYNYPMDDEMGFENARNPLKKNIKFYNEEILIISKEQRFAFMNFKDQKFQDELFTLDSDVDITCLTKVKDEDFILVGDSSGKLNVIDVEFLLKNRSTTNGVVNQINPKIPNSCCYSIEQNCSNFSSKVVAAGIGKSFALYDLRVREPKIAQNNWHCDDLSQVKFDSNSLLVNSIDGNISLWDVRSLDNCVNSATKMSRNSWIDLIPGTSSFFISSNSRLKAQNSRKRQQIVTCIDFSSGNFEAKTSLKLPNRGEEKIGKIKYDPKRRHLYVAMKNSRSIVEIYELGYGMKEYKLFGNLVTCQESHLENYSYDLCSQEGAVGCIFNDRSEDDFGFSGHVGVWEVSNSKKKANAHLDDPVFGLSGPFGGLNLR